MHTTSQKNTVNSEPTIEVLDQNGRMLCALSADSVYEQGLPHRAVAVWVCSDAGQLLFREAAEEFFDVTLFAPLPLGSSRAELAGGLAARLLSMPATVSLLGEIPPCPETRYGLTTVFSAAYPSRLLQGLALKEYLLADAEEISFLKERHWLTPLCAMILEHFAFKILQI